MDAVEALSRLATSRLADAHAEPIRGNPIEAFTFPPGALEELPGVADLRAMLRRMRRGAMRRRRR